YFFFQAEDGIRDRTVTGVQTCALPISEQLYVIRGSRPQSRARAVQERQRGGGVRGPAALLGRFRARGRLSGAEWLHGSSQQHHRSEERRVGKEGISRWAW